MLKKRKSKVIPPRTECPLSACLNFLKGSWTPNVLWYLREEPRRFNELKSDLTPISSKILSERLKRLTKIGLVNRRTADTSPPSVEYSLTDLGYKILPALEALVEVGHALKSDSN
jgi:DNA-binding HxlR family transcriptional regulator